MKKLSKRFRMISGVIDSSILYSIEDGLSVLKKASKTNFVESVDVAVNLGINTRQSEQNIRNNVVLPHGIGKKIRIAVFTQGENIELVKKEGVELVGLEDLYEKIKIEGCNFIDVILASPDVMNVVSKLGYILGPKGLMPNPKMGTVSSNILESIKNVKLGQVRYKNDKNGIIHTIIGKINFDILHLKENLETLIMSIKQVKPSQCRGTFIKKIFVSTTMGKSVLIDKNSFDMLI